MKNIKVLNKKNVLFIAPRFFNYENEIIKALERLGATVDFYDDRPDNNFFTKAMIRLGFKYVIRKKLNTYYNQFIKTTNLKTYDYVFFVDMETISEKYMKLLRSSQKGATFLLYMWDSMTNKDISSLLPYFDKCFTFDPVDSKAFEKFKLLNLFYIPDYEKIPRLACDYEFDLCFIGTAHSDRCELVDKMRIEAEKKGLRFYSFLFCHSYVLFFFKKLFDKRFRNVKMSNVSFVPLSKKDILNKITASKCIVDFQHPGQKGLTMRTFEVMGASKKLITSNSNIKLCDFYNPNNILIINKKKPDIPDLFISSDFEEVKNSIREKYHIDRWVEKIFIY